MERERRILTTSEREARINKNRSLFPEFPEGALGLPEKLLQDAREFIEQEKAAKEVDLHRAIEKASTIPPPGLDSARMDLSGEQYARITGQIFAWCEEYGVSQIFAVMHDTFMLNGLKARRTALLADTPAERAIALYRYETCEAAASILDGACDKMREWVEKQGSDPTIV